MRERGRSFYAVVGALLLSVCLSGCVAPKIGVFGTALVHMRHPTLTMTANAPLILQGYGRQGVSLSSDYLGLDPSGSMDYAIYGEGAEGAITRHGHLFVVRPSDDTRWYF